MKKKNGAYYYNKKLLRIFVDLRVDNSLVNFNYDKLGVTDVRLIRNSDDSIVKIEDISKYQ